MDQLTLVLIAFALVSILSLLSARRLFSRLQHVPELRGDKSNIYLAAILGAFCALATFGFLGQLFNNNFLEIGCFASGQFLIYFALLWSQSSYPNINKISDRLVTPVRPFMLALGIITNCFICGVFLAAGPNAFDHIFLGNPWQLKANLWLSCGVLAVSAYELVGTAIFFREVLEKIRLLHDAEGFWLWFRYRCVSLSVIVVITLCVLGSSLILSPLYLVTGWSLLEQIWLGVYATAITLSGLVFAVRNFLDDWLFGVYLKPTIARLKWIYANVVAIYPFDYRPDPYKSDDHPRYVLEAIVSDMTEILSLLYEAEVWLEAERVGQSVDQIRLKPPVFLEDDAALIVRYATKPAEATLHQFIDRPAPQALPPLKEGKRSAGYYIRLAEEVKRLEAVRFSSASQLSLADA